MKIFDLAEKLVPLLKKHGLGAGDIMTFDFGLTLRLPKGFVRLGDKKEIVYPDGFEAALKKMAGSGGEFGKGYDYGVRPDMLSLVMIENGKSLVW